MNRVIKFRGKNENGKWIYGFYYEDLSGGELKSHIFNYPNRFKVIPETVGQFIGLTDINGTDIYEGDCVSTDLQRPFSLVVCRNGTFMFECFENNEIYYDYFAGIDENETQYKYGKIIGNIHDNPQLLETYE